MHLSEGILPLRESVATTLAVSPFIIDGYRKYAKKSTSANESKPFLTMAVAICFAMTLLPIPIPIAGASSHMCATPLLALILGPRLTVLPALGILFLQAVFFAHGGISTLGANVLTLGVIGPWVTCAVFSLLKKSRLSGNLIVGFSCLLGSLSVYFADTFILSVGLSSKQAFATTFKSISMGFLPVQAPLSILESVLCVSVIRYLGSYREDFLPPDLIKVFTKRSMEAGLLVICIFTIITGAETLIAESFPAIDDIVFTSTAEKLNVESHSLFPWIEGEVQLSLFSIGFFICGYLVGSNMSKLGPNNRDVRRNNAE